MAKEVANLPGTIGEMYESRRTGEVGVLESRDEKHTSLFFRGEDGNSFNINFSTFRRDWRKYTGDKVIETSSQKEIKSAKQEKAVEKAKEHLAEPKKTEKSNDDRRKNDLSKEELQKLQKDGALVIKNAFDKVAGSVFTLEQRTIARSNQIRSRVYCGEEEVLEIWIKITKNNIGQSGWHTTKANFDKITFSKKIGDVKAKINTNPKDKRPVQFAISVDLLGVAVEDAIKSLKPLFTDKAKEAKKKAEKEEKEKK